MEGYFSYIYSMKNSGEETVTITKKEYNNLLQIQTKHQYLQFELEKLKRMIFGSRSERFVPADPGQLALDIDAEEKPAPVEPEKEEVTYTRKKKKEGKQQGHARMPLPDHLPRREEVIEPDEDITGCKQIGDNITEILEYDPGSLYVRKIIRPKYVQPREEKIITADMPTLPIPRGNAGSGLLSHIFISKYVDHLPFYRQVKQLKRQGIDMAESTMNDWFRSCCMLLEPLYDATKHIVTQSQYIQGDETPVKVLTSQKKGASHKGYFWVYYSPLEKIVCFDYRKGRGREGPEEFLKDFSGTLQTDGYKVYDSYQKKEDVTLLACMAHARRKFDEAKGNDKKRAEHALTEIQKLYKVERSAREQKLSFEARKKLRQKEAADVLEAFERWLNDQLTEVLPKSAIGVAIQYTLGLWPRLKRYVDDGRYEIDNNMVENNIRPVALGRKNYLFAGSHEGAKRAAMMYSFLGTCQQNNVEPFAWLKDVLSRLPDHNHRELYQLLPPNWSPLSK